MEQKDGFAYSFESGCGGTIKLRKDYSRFGLHRILENIVSRVDRAGRKYRDKVSLQLASGND